MLFNCFQFHYASNFQTTLRGNPFYIFYLCDNFIACALTLKTLLFDFDFARIACRVTQLLFICCCLGGVLIRGRKSRQFELTNQLSRYLCYLHSCFYWRTNSLPGFLTDCPVFFSFVSIVLNSCAEGFIGLRCEYKDVSIILG